MTAEPPNMVHVLIVEDDEDTRLLFQTVLRLSGMECSGAADGRTALQLIGERSFDAVLLDMALPDMRGTDVVAAMESIAPELVGRVVVCTAVPLRSLRTEDTLQHVSAILPKPFDIHALTAAVLGAAGVHCCAERERPWMRRSVSAQLS